LAWAVNGCASVIASVAAAILALSIGFAAVIALGAACYAFAAFALPDNHEETRTRQVAYTPLRDAT
jgi:hypothetical protein